MLLKWSGIFPCWTAKQGQEAVSLIERAYLLDDKEIIDIVYSHTVAHYSFFDPYFSNGKIASELPEFINNIKALKNENYQSSPKKNKHIPDQHYTASQSILLFYFYVERMDESDEKRELLTAMNDPKKALGYLLVYKKSELLQKQLPARDADQASVRDRVYETSYHGNFKHTFKCSPPLQNIFKLEHYNQLYVWSRSPQTPSISTPDENLCKRLYDEAMCTPSNLLQQNIIEQLLSIPFHAFQARHHFIADLLVYNIAAGRAPIVTLLLKWIDRADLSDSDLMTDLECSRYRTDHRQPEMPFRAPLSWAVMLDKESCLDAFFAIKTAEDRLSEGVLNEMQRLACSSAPLRPDMLAKYAPHVEAYIACIDRLKNQKARAQHIELVLYSNHSSLNQLIRFFQKTVIEGIKLSKARLPSLFSFNLHMPYNGPTYNISTYETHQLRLKSPVDRLTTAKNNYNTVLASSTPNNDRIIKNYFSQLISGAHPFSREQISHLVRFRTEFIDFLSKYSPKIIMEVTERTFYKPNSGVYRVFHWQGGNLLQSANKPALCQLAKLYQKANERLAQSNLTNASHATMLGNTVALNTKPQSKGDEQNSSYTGGWATPSI